jgi:hypothetical protein
LMSTAAPSQPCGALDIWFLEVTFCLKWTTRAPSSFVYVVRTIRSILSCPSNKQQCKSLLKSVCRYQTRGTCSVLVD